MTEQEQYILDHLDYIKSIMNDDEAAHSEEDSLYAYVLRAIVRGHDDPIGLATMALETKELEFSRWCA